MARKPKRKTREHRALGGSLLHVKGRAGIYGQIRAADGRRLQRLLVTGADVAKFDEAAKADPDGKVKSAVKIADERLATWALEIAKKSPVGDGLRSVTVKDFVDEFLRTIAGRVGAAHLADVTARVARFVAFAGTRSMASIGPDVVADYLAKLAQAPGQARKVPARKRDGSFILDKDGKVKEVVERGLLSPGAIRHARNALSGMWKCAIDRRAAATNPWIGNAAKIARGQQYVPVNLTDDEVARILSHVAAPLRPILMFCAETAVRLNEARTLTWLRVAKDRSAFTIEKSKSGKVRTLPTTTRARAVLAERWTSHVAKTNGPDLVFEDYSRGYTYVCFKAAVKAAGVDRRTRVHDLRHHFGNALGDANVPIDVIMAALGHSQLSTVQRYLHHADDALADAFRTVEARMGSSATRAKSA